MYFITLLKIEKGIIDDEENWTVGYFDSCRKVTDCLVEVAEGRTFYTDEGYNGAVLEKIEPNSLSNYDVDPLFYVFVDGELVEIDEKYLQRSIDTELKEKLEINSEEEVMQLLQNMTIGFAMG